MEITLPESPHIFQPGHLIYVGYTRDEGCGEGGGGGGGGGWT